MKAKDRTEIIGSIGVMSAIVLLVGLIMVSIEIIIPAIIVMCICGILLSIYG